MNCFKRKKLIASAVLGLSLTGCSGRNIHPELKEDSAVLVRNGVIETHGPFEAGERGAEYSNPVLFENTLIFGNQSVGLISFYPSIQQQRWVLKITGGVVSEITVDKGLLYFGGGDGFLYCVNAQTGHVQWRYEVRNPVISRPTLAAGRVFVTTSDDVVYSVDAGTGKWLWHYRRRSSPNATIYGAAAPLVDGSEVIAGLSDGFLVALSLEEGQLKWERKLHFGSKFTDVDASPVLDNGILYLASYDGSFYALKRKDGSVIWRFDAGGSRKATLNGEILYLPSTDGTVYALQKASGKPVWKFELDGGTPTSVVSTDRHLIFGSTFQYLYVLDKDSGKGLYRYNVGNGSGFSGTPLFDDAHQKFYILSGAGNLMTFTVRPQQKEGMARWSTDPYAF